MYQGKRKNKKWTIKEKNEEVVKNFIIYYNNERLQEKIQELAPMQFRKISCISSFLISVRFYPTGYLLCPVFCMVVKYRTEIVYFIHDA